MASPAPERNPMSESVTIPSDSENYDGNNELSSSPPSSSSSPVILYTPPTIWGLMRGAAINLVLPFINGLMLGFGELFAHEIAFRLGWSGTKVSHKSTPLTRRLRCLQRQAAPTFVVMLASTCPPSLVSFLAPFAPDNLTDPFALDFPLAPI